MCRSRISVDFVLIDLEPLLMHSSVSVRGALCSGEGGGAKALSWRCRCVTAGQQAAAIPSLTRRRNLRLIEDGLLGSAV